MIDIDTIYNEDCLVGMGNIPTGSVDAIICDLPYGTTRNKWDNVIPLDALWEQYRRIIKPKGAIVLFAQMPFTAELVNSNPKMFKYEWIWVKDNATGMLNCNYAPLKKHENILVFSDGCACFSRGSSNNMPYYPVYGRGRAYKCTRGTKSNNYDTGHMADVVTTVSDGRRFPTDVLEFNKDRGLHPTQKPVKLLEYLIRTYTKEGEVVLDNCMGSGTTAVACINTNRHYIGYEINNEYYQIANKRIGEAVRDKQYNLFNNV